MEGDRYAWLGDVSESVWLGLHEKLRRVFHQYIIPSRALRLQIL